MRKKIFFVIAFLFLFSFLSIKLYAYTAIKKEITVGVAGDVDDKHMPVLDSSTGVVNITEPVSAYGNTNELIATSNNDFKFSFYMENGHVVCINPRYTFRTADDHQFLAFFRPANKSQVLVVDANNKYLGSLLVDFDSQLLEADFDQFKAKLINKPGYEFEKWNESFPLVASEELIIVRATYQSNITELFNVIVVDEEFSPIMQKTVAYGKTITLVAPEVDGKQFSYWMIGDEILSYNSIHTLSVYHDIVISAIYEVELDVQPVSYLNPHVVCDNNILYFLVQNYIPIGYEVIEQGLIYINSDTFIEEDILIDSLNVERIRAKRVSPYNEFAVMRNTLEYHNLYLRSYLVVQDKDKNIEIIYSSQMMKSFRFSIQYDLDGGTNHPENKFIYCVYEPFTFKAPTRTGYNFLGWYYTSDFTDEGITSTEDLAGNIVIHAKWEEESFLINYVLNGGSISSPIDSYKPSVLPLTLPEAKKDGYTFVGWYLNPEFTGDKIFEIPSGTTGEKTYYAQYAMEEFSIDYFSNGGKYITTHDDIRVEFLTDFYEFSKPSVDLMTFMHGVGKNSGFEGTWRTPVEGKSDILIDRLYAESSREADASKNYFINQPVYNAKWLPFFDLLDVLVKETNNEQSFWGSPWTGNIRLNEFITGKRYATEPRFLELDIISSKLINSYNIGSTFDLAIPKKDGYVFAGWYKNANFIGKGLTQIPKGMHGDLQLYAKWIKPGETNTEIIPVLSITGVEHTYVGQEFNLQVKCMPTIAEATYKYYSSNPAVAEVDSDGRVKAKGLGSVTITVRLSLDESYLCSINVTVHPEPNDIDLIAKEELIVGQRMQLEAIIYPSETYQGVEWSVSDASIARIDENGLLVGLTDGKVVVTAKSKLNQNILATFNITVIDNRKIIVENENISITQYQTYSIAASILGEPKTTLTYTSSNPNIATVDQTGKITAKDDGKVTITISLLDNSYIQKNINVTVIGVPSITISPISATVKVNETITLAATIKHLTNTNVTWSSSNSEIATVTSTGIVKGLKAGTVTITATSQADATLKATAIIKVTDSSVLTIETKDGTTMQAGDNTNQLYVYDYNDKAISRTECTFISSNSNVVTVSTYGTISANGVGTATVTVKYGTATGTITLTVIERTTPVTLVVSADPGTTLMAGEKGYQLFVKDSLGKDISRLDCTFTSSNANVATVSAYGSISGLSAGTATITVSYNNMSAKITLTIKGRPEVILSPTSPSVVVGKTVTITAKVNYLSNTGVTWKSSNTNVATVSSTGVVTGKAVGSAVITATAVGDSQVQATVTVKVTSALPVENKRNTIISIALGEKGYREGANNNTKYGAWFGMNYEPWCAMFVSWCAYQAGVPTTIIPKYASVYLGLQWYINKGSTYYKTYAQTQSGAYVPQCGDIVFFQSNGASHTGLVIRCEGDIMYTIEGNTSDQVLVRYYYYKNYNKITGYGVPAYPASSTPITKFSVAGASYGGGSSTT